MIYILLALRKDFTDDWNAQIVSKAAPKLRKHTQQWKKMPFQGTFRDNCIEDAMSSLRAQLV